MKINSASIYALNIPFVESFRHNLHDRNCSDSIIVKVTSKCGISGYGEGVPRPYVTGETQKTSVEYIRSELLPRILNSDFGGVDMQDVWAYTHDLLRNQDTRVTVVWNAARCAVELALIDCLFRSRNASISALLPPASQAVTYSAVITAGSIARIEKIAQKCKTEGFKQIKMKVSEFKDVMSIAIVREILGPSASIRLDANGAFNQETALQFLAEAVKYNIECIEQPIPHGNLSEWATLRSASPIPIMVDESVVTMLDAEMLIEKQAVDFFNLRISKCGGLHQTLAIAKLARAAGIGIQLGCQVGETAILSAAGRHLAAHLKDLRYIEGSYGTHLLVEDIAEENIVFGYGGSAPVLIGPGLGITVREELVDKYAEDIITVC